jgi:hypothetical protein
MKVYVYTNSKAELNRRISRGDEIICTEYNAFNPRGYTTRYFLSDLEDKTTIALYKELIDGKPLPYAWGTYEMEKNIVK